LNIIGSTQTYQSTIGQIWTIWFRISKSEKHKLTYVNSLCRSIIVQSSKNSWLAEHVVLITDYRNIQEDKLENKIVELDDQ